MTPKGFTLDLRHAPFNERYIDKLRGVINIALATHTRTMAIIMLLRFPDYNDCDDSIANTPDMSSGVFSRFIESLDAKITAYQRRLQSRGQRIYTCKLTYAWVREYGAEGKPHYHAVLFVNKDTFCSLGDFTRRSDNLGSFIEEAWSSALKTQDTPEYRTLVHFPDNPLYYLNGNADNFEAASAYESLSFRLSYLAKERSKIYSREQRSFGGSQGRKP
ncbi:inovirus Gp2 family protein [Hafnia alvei]|uniref:inovirus Gp2 family protein n=1 Tax=Hafnia alvei TaxID=569 RepID=UPI0014125992|nr:inovirus Gp2 family protein [Hafnia alvei]QIP57516.1 inovirus Gp2 family protein [Hafnia alvei]